MSAIDYQSRKDPRVYKPLIDAELLDLAELVGSDAVLLQESLDSIDASALGPWEYLTTAIRETKPLLWTERLWDALHGKPLAQLWEAKGMYFPSHGGETPDVDDWYDDGVRWIYTDRYPQEARAALEHDEYWAGIDAEVYGVFLEDGVTKVFFADRQRFCLLGEDPVDFIQKQVSSLVRTAGDEASRR